MDDIDMTYQAPQYEMFSDLNSRNKDGELINNDEAIVKPT